jgi:hypothetical protein
MGLFESPAAVYQAQKAPVSEPLENSGLVNGWHLIFCPENQTYFSFRGSLDKATTGYDKCGIKVGGNTEHNPYKLPSEVNFPIFGAIEFLP